MSSLRIPARSIFRFVGVFYCRVLLICQFIALNDEETSEAVKTAEGVESVEPAPVETTDNAVMRKLLVSMVNLLSKCSLCVVLIDFLGGFI